MHKMPHSAINLFGIFTLLARSYCSQCHAWLSFIWCLANMMMTFINYARYIVIHSGENTYLICVCFLVFHPPIFFMNLTWKTKNAMNYDNICNTHAWKNNSSAWFFYVCSDHCFNYKKTDLCPKILCDKKYLALEMPICIFSLLVIWSNFDNLYPLWDLPLCIIYPRKTVILFDCMMDLAQCLSLSILWA